MPSAALWQSRQRADGVQEHIEIHEEAKQNNERRKSMTDGSYLLARRLIPSKKVCKVGALFSSGKWFNSFAVLVAPT